MYSTQIAYERTQTTHCPDNFKSLNLQSLLIMSLNGPWTKSLPVEFTGAPFNTKLVGVDTTLIIPGTQPKTLLVPLIKFKNSTHNIQTLLDRQQDSNTGLTLT